MRFVKTGFGPGLDMGCAGNRLQWLFVWVGLAAIVGLNAYRFLVLQPQDQYRQTGIAPTAVKAHPVATQQPDWTSWPGDGCIDHIQPEIAPQVAAAMAELDKADPNYKGLVCQYVPAVRIADSNWKKGNHLSKGVIAIDPYWLNQPVPLAGYIYHEGMHGYLSESGLSNGMSVAEEEQFIMSHEANLVESLGDRRMADWLRSLDGNHN